MANQHSHTPGLFITGTDTDVGKTWVSALIVRELRTAGVRAGVFKPACSGAEFHASADGSRRAVWPDVEALADAAGIEDADAVCPLRFEAPLAPPVAARAEGRVVSRDVILAAFRRQQATCEVLVVEGVGGLLCPLTDQATIADFAVEAGYPLVVVARLGLGTINHTLLTLTVAKQCGLTVAGVILNDADGLAETPAGRTNPGELAARIDVPLLGIVPQNARAACLRDRVTPARIDWLQLATVSSRPRD